MFTPLLSWLFTVVFALVAVYSLVRLSELTSDGDRSGSRVAELSHLLMSIAMIAMAWAWTGGSSSASGVVQIVVFGVFTVWFLVRLVRRTPGHTRIGEGYHLTMNAAMVWMVAAMPQIMGMTTGAAGGAGGTMAGMPGMSGMGGDGPGTRSSLAVSSTPVWAGVVTWTFVVLLLAGAVLWARGVARPDSVARHRCCDAALPDPGPSSGAGAVVVASPTSGTRTLSPRFDAACHLLMSLGMAGMLLAMLRAGW